MKKKRHTYLAVGGRPAMHLRMQSRMIESLLVRNETKVAEAACSFNVSFGLIREREAIATMYVVYAFYPMPAKIAAVQ